MTRVCGIGPSLARRLARDGYKNGALHVVNVLLAGEMSIYS